MFMAEIYKHEKSVCITDAKITQLLQLFYKQMPIRYIFMDSNRSIVYLAHKPDTLSTETSYNSARNVVWRQPTQYSVQQSRMPDISRISELKPRLAMR